MRAERSASDQWTGMCPLIVERVDLGGQRENHLHMGFGLQNQSRVEVSKYLLKKLEQWAHQQPLSIL